MMRRMITLLFCCLAANVQANDERYQAGKQLFDSRCSGSCHQAPDAGQLNAKQWRIVLNTMQQRMQAAGLTPLNDEELQQVLHYLGNGQ